MKRLKRELSSLFFTTLTIAFATGCVSDTYSKNISSAQRDVSSLTQRPGNETTASDDSKPRYRGCEDGLAVTLFQRKAVVDEAVLQAEQELAKNLASIKDPDFRERIATFAAATIDDSVPLISMDRSCWAEFYDGQKKLGAGDEAGAKESGEAWRICLEAMFPDRVAIARPYFSCFSPEPATASKAEPPSSF
ncbi:hypothetical protein BH10BDE1_BH10BDE1_26120 [soil metagenome]